MGRSAPEPAKGGGGLFERAKKALGFAKESAASAPEQDDDALSAFSDDESPKVVDGLAAGAGEDIGGMFARQLASGLWEARDASDAGRLVETTACLVRCVRASVDSSHSVYGAQVTKAVDALCALAEAFAQKGEADAQVVQALLAAAAVSTGKRARARVAAVAQAAKSGAVKAIVADLASQDAAKTKLA
jgi:Ca-activated chloride channel family protein